LYDGPAAEEIHAAKGHERKLREPLLPEGVDATIDYEIEDDEVQRLKLTLTGEFETIQQIEIKFRTCQSS